MAIEITPERKESTVGQKILLIFSIVFLAVAIGSYFYFNNFAIPQKVTELSKATSALAALTDKDLATKEADLRTAKDYIADFKILYENNPKSSAFFSAFQRWAHPKITYSGFALDVANKKATLHGTTSNFQNVMQQIALLNSETTIGSFDIENVQLSQTGGVSFDLSMTLKSDIFK
jgi:hypothetical protein